MVTAEDIKFIPQGYSGDQEQTKRPIVGPDGQIVNMDSRQIAAGILGEDPNNPNTWIIPIDDQKFTLGELRTWEGLQRAHAANDKLGLDWLKSLEQTTQVSPAPSHRSTLTWADSRPTTQSEGLPQMTPGVEQAFGSIFKQARRESRQSPNLFRRLVSTLLHRS